MAFQVIQERLETLRQTTRQAEELISRLADIKFQPGSVPQDADDGHVGAELSSEIQEMLKDQEEDLELLEQEVRDLHPGRPGSARDHEKALLAEKAALEAKQLKLARASFRKAQLAAKRSLERSQRAERELLLSSIVNQPASSSGKAPPLLRRKNTAASVELSQEEKAVAAAGDVTAALRRTHALMQTELSRSQFANDTLQESTAALAQLGETYSSLDSMLASSRNLLSTLLRSQKSDTWYLETAFYVLLATIVWLVFRRFIYGPAWWLLWLPLKTFYTAWMGVFAAAGLRGGQVANAAGPGATVILERPSLVVYSTATRGASRPSVIESRAPSVNVGGQRTGSSPAGTQPAGSGGSLVEEVGKIIDESQREGGVGHQARDGERVMDQERGGPPNPKKRMWEEEKEAKKEAEKEAQQREKDEL